MTTNTKRKFNWGDSVRLRSNRFIPKRSGALAEICGIKHIETQAHADTVIEGKVGVDAYLIEFSDGTSVEVASSLLEEP